MYSTRGREVLSPTHTHEHSKQQKQKSGWCRLVIASATVADVVGDELDAGEISRM